MARLKVVSRLSSLFGYWADLALTYPNLATLAAAAKLPAARQAVGLFHLDSESSRLERKISRPPAQAASGEKD